MGRNKSNDKIMSHTIQLRNSQIGWIESNKEVKINRFFRDQLDKLIQFKTAIKSI